MRSTYNAAALSRYRGSSRVRLISPNGTRTCPRRPRCVRDTIRRRRRFGRLSIGAGNATSGAGRRLLRGPRVVALTCGRTRRRSFRIAVTGESAGGGLAAATVLLARDRAQYAVAFQHLVFPMLDDRTVTQRDPSPHLGEFVWTREANLFGWTSLLGREPGGTDVSPYAAPARADDLARLPPTFLASGALDLFLEGEPRLLAPLDPRRRTDRSTHFSRCATRLHDGRVGAWTEVRASSAGNAGPSNWVGDSRSPIR